jgi:hypothetical protein
MPAGKKTKESLEKGGPADEQFATAQRRIQQTHEAGSKELNLSDLSELSKLPPEISALTDLQYLSLYNTKVSDLAPIAGLVSLHALHLQSTQVSELSSIADLTTLQMAAQEEVPRGLYYAQTPAARKQPYSRLVALKQPARTVETINALRRQRGLPEFVPEGYERPKNIEQILSVREDGDDGMPTGGEGQPPAEPLPDPSPATKFTVVAGRVDVVPPAAWTGRKDQAALYHARARKLAADLADRLLLTDAVPDVAASVAALSDLLGGDLDLVQPDQLRLASRSISAKARAYGHPGAQWEISADSVSAIFELADVLVDLQGFAKADIEDNERAIRELELTPEGAAEAKEALDEITALVENSPQIVTAKTEDSFVAAAEVSATAATADVVINVEGERILLTENLALAIARELGRESPDDSRTSQDKRQESPPTSRRSKKRRAARSRKAGDAWTRVLRRLDEKGPEKTADAMIEAMTSAIKHSPKTLAGLGAFIYMVAQASPSLLSYGPIALTLTWIGYEIMRRSKSTK